MNNYKIEIWNNLKFFLERLKAMRGSKVLDLKGGFCVSNLCESASENWVFYPRDSKFSIKIF